jgi:hypothetical protein
VKIKPFEIEIRPSGSFIDIHLLLPKRLRNKKKILFIEKSAYLRLKEYVSYLERELKE